MRRRFAEIDPEGFFDFQATRPHVRLEEGYTRRIDWPETVFYHARPAGIDRDAVLLLGVEPNLRWRTFSGLIVDFSRELGVELVVTLGALLADVPHTRPAPVTGSATDPDLVEQLGLQASRYEGPTGIVGVVHDACKPGGDPVGEPVGGGSALRLAGTEPEGGGGTVPAARVCCSVPRIDTGELDEAADAYVRQVSEAIAADEETAAYVEELERRVDELDESELPSGDRSPPSSSRFLREREEGERRTDRLGEH